MGGAGRARRQGTQAEVVGRSCTEHRTGADAQQPSATEPFDTSTPIGTFLFQLLGSLAELDRAQVLEQLTRGRDRVARNGKWTGGLVPFGYTVDRNGCLTPNQRLVDVLEMTEAEVVRDLYQRMAAGSSSVAEARRLNALSVPTTRYHSNGTMRAYGQKWHPGPIAGMITNPTYRGTHVLDSRYGAIERDVPPLVDVALWEQANAQLKRNQRLPKSNATRTYLLRGLITCGQCGSAYVGQVFTFRSGNQGAYYRCCGRSPDHYARQNKCRARVVNALWLERLVWEDCRTFICTPGEALAEAQRQLHDRMRQVAHMDQERGHYVQALAEKTQERDRVMTLFRRGRIALRDAEAKLDDITREAVDYYRTTVCPHTSTTLCIAADRDNRLYTSVYRMCAQPKILGSILIDIAACLLHSCPCVAVTTEDDL